jgi:hypothetical protein
MGWAFTVSKNPSGARLTAPISADLVKSDDIPMDIPASNSIDIIYSGGMPVIKLNGKVISSASANPNPRNLNFDPKNSLQIVSSAGVRITEWTLQHLDTQPK